MSAGAAAASESERSRRRAQELRDRADRLDQRAEKYERGGAGEQQVARALDPLLGAGYLRIDDIRWPGTTKGNIDHVVFGPSGMFVVDAKVWNGDVVVRNGVLRQNGYRRTRETDKVLRMTADLRAHLGASVGDCQAVLCLVGQPRTPAANAEGVTVVGVDEIAPWLFGRRVIWPVSHVEALAAWLPHVLLPAVPGTPVRVVGPAPSRPAPEQTAVRAHSPAPVARSGGLYGWLRR